ncbi:MAG: hypothetical protein J3Q66DRAFT_329710 [Benniella sp.]|nr:MAG: hypothetical protein J3Q66DRAFT_329710 [Benniella sp.]
MHPPHSLLDSLSSETELGLWCAAGFGPSDQSALEETGSTSCLPLGKSASQPEEMRTLNVIGYDPETSSLVLVNSVRLSLFGRKIKATSPGPSDEEVPLQAYDPSSDTQRVIGCKLSLEFRRLPRSRGICIVFKVHADPSVDCIGVAVSGSNYLWWKRSSKTKGRALPKQSTTTSRFTTLICNRLELLDFVGQSVILQLTFLPTARSTLPVTTWVAITKRETECLAQPFHTQTQAYKRTWVATRNTHALLLAAARTGE